MVDALNFIQLKVVAWRQCHVPGERGKVVNVLLVAITIEVEITTIHSGGTHREIGVGCAN